MSAYTRRKKKPVKPKKDQVYHKDGHYYGYFRDLDTWVMYNPGCYNWDVGIVPFQYKHKRSDYEAGAALRMVLLTGGSWKTTLDRLRMALSIIEATPGQIAKLVAGYTDSEEIRYHQHSRAVHLPTRRVKEWGPTDKDPNWISIEGELVRLFLREKGFLRNAPIVQ